MSIKFTESAGKALENALHLAEEFGHTYIGSEHILLALAEDKGSQAAEMLARCGVDNEKIRNAIVDYSGSGEKTKLTPRDLTPKCRKIISDAYEISVSNGASQVDTEHILTTLCEEKRSVASEILRKLRVNLKKIKIENK